ncbi:hypothetical protein ATZ33_10920 [Enterococcus silesiacus]|uniref:Transcriptional regulator, AbrB family n=1 Tax=Enterococcus silesiacus TaxID=332949 RepID=A0A0S3KC93_9ENTE|nr:hypothetical protein [Enterococcus silesiacus]ALS01871.1 hypothetical protein ATZ33_10920 [Enterococcus silesiacus]OJG92132.1 transcriptional regulator, AbrB family [Enterococcus silesiacus]
MLFAKSRLQRNSAITDFPTHNREKTELNTELNKEYIVVYAISGSVALIQKIDDPFSEGYEGEFYEADEWSELAPW